MRVALALATAAGLVAAGLALDSPEFTGNLLAEGVGVVVSVVVAVTLVERWLSRERARRWQRVRSQTVRAIDANLADIAFRFSLRIPPPRDIGLDFYTGDVPRAEIAAEIRDLAEQLRERAEELGKTPDADTIVIAEHGKPQRQGRITVDSEATKARLYADFLDTSSTRDLYDDVSPVLRQLRDVLTPRVIDLADDPRLVELLGDIEAAERQWLSNLEVIEHWGAPDHFGWEAAAEFLGSLAGVIEYLAPDVDHLSPPAAPLARGRTGQHLAR